MTPEAQPDPYEVLNVARSATQSEIRAAYQVLVLKFHPDRHQGNPLEDLASARLAEINRAYETLSDQARRAAYDASASAAAPAGQVRVDSRIRKRMIGALALLLVIPLVVRLGAILVRGITILGRDLFEATASLPGGRPAVVVAAALIVLAVALRRRRRS